MANLHPLIEAELEGMGVTPAPRGVGRPKGSCYADPEVAARREVARICSTPEGYEDEMLENGASIPQVHLSQEKVIHRTMIYLKSLGLSNVEIAAKTNYTPVSVANVLAQPWAKQRLVKELVDAGKNVIEEMLRGAGADSVATLIAVRDDAKAPPATRVTAADKLLDRLLGKAVQRTENVNLTKKVDSLEEIDAELAHLTAQAELLTGKSKIRDTNAPRSQSDVQASN